VNRNVNKKKRKIALISLAIFLTMLIYPVGQLTWQKLSTVNRGNCIIPNASASVFEMNLNLIRQKCGLKVEIEQNTPLTYIESKVASLRIAEVIRHNNLVTNYLPFAKIKTLIIYQDTKHRAEDSVAAATYSSPNSRIIFHGQSALCNTTHELFHGLQRGVSYSSSYYDHSIGSRYLGIDPWITRYIFENQSKLALSKTISEEESFNRFGTVFFAKSHKNGKTKVGHLELGSYLTSQFTILPKITNPITLGNLERLIEATSIATKQDYYSSPQIQKLYLKMGLIQQYVTTSILLEKKQDLTQAEQDQIEFTIQTLTEMYNDLMALDNQTSKEFEYKVLDKNLAFQMTIFGLFLFVFLTVIKSLIKSLRHKKR
jgi:hypothetical protein